MFFTPERFAGEQAQRMESTRGRLLVASCSSASALAGSVVRRYDELLADADSEESVLHMENIDWQFSDTTTCVRLDHHVGGYDVFLFQALLDPTSERSVDENYMALLIAARTFREHGAQHVTAVVPYLPYARQDKPTAFQREPTTAKLIADMTAVSGVDRLIAWEPHSGQIRGFYGDMPVTMLKSLILFVEEFGCFQDADDVIAVAPDAGASKLITHFGRALGLTCAIGSKTRPEAEVAVISDVIGDFRGKTKAVVLDDIVSTAGTVYELVKRLTEKGIREVYLAASHNLCQSKARQRLIELHEDYGLKRFVVTNSIPQTDEFASLPFLKVRCLSDTLARTINRIHYNRSVSEVFDLS